MLSAVCYNTELDEDAVFDVDSESLLKACQNLLVLVASTDLYVDEKFRFAHLSIQEYCETRLWNESEVHAFAAKTCILRLLDTETLEPFQRRHRITHRYLSDHAGRMWIYHTQRHGSMISDARLESLIRRFFNRSGDFPMGFDSWYSSRCSRAHLEDESGRGCRLLCTKGMDISDVHLTGKHDNVASILLFSKTLQLSGPVLHTVPAPLEKAQLIGLFSSSSILPGFMAFVETKKATYEPLELQGAGVVYAIIHDLLSTQSYSSS